LEPETIKLYNGVLRSGNGGVAANLCLEDPIWQPLPEKGLTQWWGRPFYSAFMSTRLSFPPIAGVGIL